MNREEIRNQIIEFIFDEYVEDESMELGEKTPLISSGLIDSFSMQSLKMFLEEEYDIKLSDEEATTEAFDSVASIVEMVEAAKARG